MTDLQRALRFLSAVRSARGEYAYWAEEIRAAVAVPSDDMRDLGRRLRRGDRDAYSLWCSSTDARRLTRRRAEALGLR